MGALGRTPHRKNQKGCQKKGGRTSIHRSYILAQPLSQALRRSQIAIDFFTNFCYPESVFARIRVYPSAFRPLFLSFLQSWFREQSDKDKLHSKGTNL